MWFQQRFGFREQDPDQVRENLHLEGRRIRSRVNGVDVGCGWLECPRLETLRGLDRRLPTDGASRVTEVIGDVADLHRDPAHAGALFQAASQFNLLEMVSPDVPPEAGVGGYSNDRTQGPACAVACGGGTVYRNYFVPVDGGLGQGADRQIDTLADLEAALGHGHWTMRNGYALAHTDGLDAIAAHLGDASTAERDRLRGLVRVGVQHDVDVLDTHHRVTQVYAAALPVAYGSPPTEAWAPFARLVLEAAYEATLRIARIWQAEPVFLTLLGGGVFGNADDWIEDAIVRAVERIPGLDIRIVSYGQADPRVQRIRRRLPEGATRPAGRTSRAFPIRVDTVEAPGGPDIGLTLAPGKVQPNASSGPWRRSLEADLERLRHHHQVDDLICLVEDHELDMLRIQDLPARARAHGIHLHRLPIRDGRAPNDLEAVHDLLGRIASWRARGRRVVFHCKGGLGRAGTLATCALIHAGVDPADALEQVRRARPGAVETRDQLDFIAGFAPR